MEKAFDGPSEGTDEKEKDKIIGNCKVFTQTQKDTA